jgi:hypothetical protein
MLVGPSAAKRCIESFNGRILFMPSNYCRDAATFPSTGRSRWEPQSLTLSHYYLLCLVSLTTLSTLLGQTAVLDARETDNDHKHPLGPMAATPASLTVDTIVEDYLLVTNKIELETSSKCGFASAVEVQRRFEYDFKLAGIKVVMWHYRSLAADGKPALDEGLCLCLCLCLRVRVCACMSVSMCSARCGGAREVYLSCTPT